MTPELPFFFIANSKLFSHLPLAIPFRENLGKEPLQCFLLPCKFHLRWEKLPKPHPSPSSSCAHTAAPHLPLHHTGFICTILLLYSTSLPFLMSSDIVPDWIFVFPSLVFVLFLGWWFIWVWGGFLGFLFVWFWVGFFFSSLQLLFPRHWCVPCIPVTLDPEH